jgi:cyclophilin family peptidyl-prolyl cis-trans isomerase
VPRHPKVLLATLFCLLAGLCAGCGSTTGDGGPPTASIEADGGAARADARDSDRPRVARHPVLAIVTSLGTITVELDRAEAPLTVDNFLNYVSKNQYDDTIFHQVDRGFMALAGGFHGDMSPVPAEFPIRNEAQNGLKNLRGTIAMARPGDSIDSATSQFFFNLADNPSLDYQPGGLENYGYCVFGKVTAGQDVLDRIGEVSVADAVNLPNMPREPLIIESIRRVR